MILKWLESSITPGELYVNTNSTLIHENSAIISKYSMPFYVISDTIHSM